MPFFKYTAVSKEGKEITDIEEALSVSHLKTKLSSKGLIPIEITQIEKKESKKLFNFSFRKKDISKEELALLLYEMGVLIEKSVHITNAVEIVAKQTENENLKNKLLTVQTHLKEGLSIAEAFERANIFPKFLVEMIKAGETSGALDKIFLSASQFIEKQEEFKKQIINSLIYPTVVILVGFVAMVVIMIYVVPTITKLYSQFGKELPFATKFVIGLSYFFSKVISIFPLFVVLLIVFRKKIFKEKLIDKVKLRVLFFKNVHLYSIYANWGNTLSLLLKGGLTLDKAVEIANETITNSLIKERFLKVAKEINKGKSLSEVLSKENLLSDSNIQLIKIGEETGELESMLEILARIYKKETEKLINRFMSLLEPAILIILSTFIGFFIFATLLPIFDLTVR
ncbi:MAG TPA: type II secretion system F family protein, partial [Hydrogenothermaceae bacterium]|nr:type II secretion system F family protein [Hydrogenothermaceae bacterium]